METRELSMLLDDFMNSNASRVFELEVNDEKESPIDLSGNNNFRYSLLKEAYDLQYVLEIIDNLESIKEVVKKKHEMLSQLLELYMNSDDIELTDQDIELLNYYKVNVTRSSSKRKRSKKKLVEEKVLVEGNKGIETMDDILSKSYGIFTGVEVEK